ncbi:MAG: ribonuclease III [Bdellovibrionaceae bacterium]|nr:ribonuclease III [Bdellovibrionales bacterium]MCB9083912.1 ribonuclease III [Pseudobdellovibrionaceae bacterium]
MTLQEKLGHRFQNESLLVQALTHKSFHNENGESSPGHNERLEFLGDAVLDLVLSDLLMQRFPELPEGDLSKIRASFVNEAVLAQMAQEFGLDQYMRLGRGEILTGGAAKPRILASALEAIIGAYYQDAGFQPSYEWISQLFGSRIDNLDLSLHFATDYKTRLQELVQERHKEAPRYAVTKSEGPDHEKTFYVDVRIGERVVASGQGRSKKSAEQEAARVALESLK